LATGNDRRHEGRGRGRGGLTARPRGRARETQLRGRALAALCVAVFCLLALVAQAAGSRAQSGRNRTPQPPAGKTGEGTRPAAPAIEGPVAEPETSTRPAAVIPRSTKGPLPARTKDAGSDAAGAGDDEVVRVSTSLVPLPAAVTDREGRAVTGLRLEDFELLVDGRPRPLAELSRSETPANIVLLFDNSSSLNATRAFQKEAAIRFLRTVLRPVDRAALYSISTAPELIRRLTGDAGALAHTVENFPKPKGATALFDSLAEAADYVGAEPGRNVFVVVSDGTDTASELDFDAALSTVLRNHVQVYVLRIGHSDNANLRDLAGERRFQEFAAQTGGAVFVPRTREDFQRAFTRIATDLAEQYVLSYYPTEEDRAARFRTLTLRVRNRPGLEVRTRKGFYPPRG
jgi:VWFA-related protein